MSKHPNIPRVHRPSSPPKITTTQVSTRQFSGPLPSPEVLERYDAIHPGTAGRIITMAEDNNRHMQTMDKMVLTATYQERSKGQWFGLIIGLASLATCAFGFWMGHAQEAAWLGGSTIVGLVSVFVFGRILKKSP